MRTQPRKPEMSVANKRTLPVDRRQPTNCQGGWFYVNAGSISTVAPPHMGGVNAGIATVTRRQLQAALKLMRKRTSDRGEKR